MKADLNFLFVPAPFLLAAVAFQHYGDVNESTVCVLFAAVFTLFYMKRKQNE